MKCLKGEGKSSSLIEVEGAWDSPSLHREHKLEKRVKGENCGAILPLFNVELGPLTVNLDL